MTDGEQSVRAFVVHNTLLNDVKTDAAIKGV